MEKALHQHMAGPMSYYKLDPSTYFPLLGHLGGGLATPGGFMPHPSMMQMSPEVERQFQLYREMLMQANPAMNPWLHMNKNPDGDRASK